MMFFNSTEVALPVEDQQRYCDDAQHHANDRCHKWCFPILLCLVHPATIGGVSRCGCKTKKEIVKFQLQNLLSKFVLLLLFIFIFFQRVKSEEQFVAQDSTDNRGSS